MSADLSVDKGGWLIALTNQCIALSPQVEEGNSVYAKLAYSPSYFQASKTEKLLNLLDGFAQ